MKCVKSTNGKEAPVRVSNERAEILVKNGSHAYVPKSEWKDGGRKR